MDTTLILTIGIIIFGGIVSISLYNSWLKAKDSGTDDETSGVKFLRFIGVLIGTVLLVAGLIKVLIFD